MLQVKRNETSCAFHYKDMPALHRIDEHARLIVTTWSGEATDRELIDALRRYQQDIRSRPNYHGFNEIVDFSGASDYRLSTEGLRMLVKVAAEGDVQGLKTRLAIVVGSPFAYGLARVYEAYRTLVPSLHKEVHVFRNYGEAVEWMTGSHAAEHRG